MTDLRTAAQQALEALKDDQYRLVEVSPNQYEYKTDLAIAALERALAQQAEPVGAVLVNRESREGVMFYSVDMIPDPATLKDRFELVKVYTAPPQRKPLTEEEIERICMTYQSPRQAARAIERAHGIRDNT